MQATTGKNPTYITLKSATEPDRSFFLTIFRFLSKTLYTASPRTMIFKNKLICDIFLDFVYYSHDVSRHQITELHRSQKYTKPWGFRPFLSNIQEFTEHLWILKSLFKNKHRITPTQTTSKILKHAEDTSLINSLVMKSFVVSWRWKCHLSASTSHSSNKMTFHESCTLCSPYVIHNTNLTMNIPSEHWEANKWNIISFKFKYYRKLHNTQFFLHMESYLGQFWLLASSFQH